MVGLNYLVKRPKGYHHRVAAKVISKIERGRPATSVHDFVLAVFRARARAALLGGFLVCAMQFRNVLLILVCQLNLRAPQIMCDGNCFTVEHCLVESD